MVYIQVFVFHYSTYRHMHLFCKYYSTAYTVHYSEENTSLISQPRFFPPFCSLQTWRLKAMLLSSACHEILLPSLEIVIMICHAFKFVAGNLAQLRK